MKKFIIFALSTISFCNAAPEWLKEKLEIAISNSDDQTVDLLLRQTELTAPERNILLDRVQGVIDLRNQNIPASNEVDYSRGLKRQTIGSLLSWVIGPAFFLSSLTIAASEEDGRYLLVGSIMSGIAIAIGAGINALGEQAHQEELNKVESRRLLTQALAIKKMIINN